MMGCTGRFSEVRIPKEAKRATERGKEGRKIGKVECMKKDREGNKGKTIMEGKTQSVTISQSTRLLTET